MGRKNNIIFFSWTEFAGFPYIDRLKSSFMIRTILSSGSRLILTVMATTLMAFGAHSQSPQFSHQTIFVTDLDRAANFYEKELELKRIPEPFHDGRYVWFRVSEHGQLHVVSGAKEDIPHDINILLAFSVPSIDEFVKHLDAMNVKYGNWAQNDKTPQLRPDKVKQVYLQDPDGYWIEINDDKF